jgi:hypothetical protein
MPMLNKFHIVNLLMAGSRNVTSGTDTKNSKVRPIVSCLLKPCLDTSLELEVHIRKNKTILASPTSEQVTTR